MNESTKEKLDIVFKSVDMDRDLDAIYRWMHEPHVVEYWNLNLSYSSYKSHLQKALSDSHQNLYIGYINGTPISYWEIYWVKGDVIEDYYENNIYDQGVHLLIGEKSYLNKGYALPLLKNAVRKMFEDKRTKKVVAEPDIRNKKMIYLFEKCGFHAVKQIKLPDKIGLLMQCEREIFEKVCNDVNEKETF